MAARDLITARACAGALLFVVGAALLTSRAYGEAAPGQNQAVGQPKLSLRVAYFGDLGSERGKDFTRFLQSHFANVNQAELSSFTEKSAPNYDVVILDYDELKVENNRIQMPPIAVSRAYSRPVITIGATGAMVCGRLGLKTGYL